MEGVEIFSFYDSVMDECPLLLVLTFFENSLGLGIFIIVCIGVSTCPSKAPPPLKSTKCLSPPFLGNSHLYTVFFREPPSPLKVQFFSGPQKYSSFSPLTLSYLLKITKFLIKVSQFEFFVMTERKTFLLINLFCH